MAGSKGQTITNAELAPPATLPETTKTTLSADAPTSDAAQDEETTQIPPLTTELVKKAEARVQALRLVADSVAQQRQSASKALIMHPLSLTGLTAAFAIILRLVRGDPVKNPDKVLNGGDWAIIGTTFVGVLMSFLVLVRRVTAGYIAEAERVGTWKWYNQGRSEEEEKTSGMKVLGGHDEILLTKFGDEPIGAIVFRGVQRVSLKGGKTRTQIRGWTVAQKYRGKSVGTALLEDTISLAYEKGWADEGIEIAPDHANSKKVLPSVFNKTVDKNNEEARLVLDAKVTAFERGLRAQRIEEEAKKMAATNGNKKK